jgi:hypothetical protein
LPEQSAIRAEIRFREIAAPLYPDRGTESPELTITLSLLALPDDPELERLVEAIFYKGETLEVYGNNLIDMYKKEYAGMTETLKKHPDMPAEIMNWDYAESLDISEPFNSIAVINQSQEYYLGGAHGMREKKYAVIDTAKVRQLKITDIVKSTAIPALRSRIEGALRTLAGIDGKTPLSQGGFFEDTVEIPDNFFLDSQGLGFHWDPYEIAPYSTGPIEIILPIEEIRNLLKADIPF